MDKWKESELEKMKVGGNRRMKDFLEQRNATGLPIRTKYNTKAAALYKDKVQDNLIFWVSFFGLGICYIDGFVTLTRLKL